MLDTTTWTTARPLLPEVVAAVRENNGAALLPAGWSYTWSNTSKAGKFNSRGKLTFDHKPTGLHAYGTAERLEGWTASLPRVLRGFNGIQLKDDAEIAASLECVHNILGEISHPSQAAETLRRMDVAMNLPFDRPQAVINALRHNHHPWIRREKTEYENGNIRFPGTQVVFQAYWKRPPVRTPPRQKKWHTPGVLRLEVQLKNIDKIAEFLDLEDGSRVWLPPRRRDIYEAFRRFMLGFERRGYRTDKCTMASLLALCLSQGVCLPTGESVVDWHRLGVSADAHRKMCKAVAAVVSASSDIDWEELLPVHTIPATMDVSADMGTRQVAPVQLTRTWPRPTGEQLAAWMASTSTDEDE